ncbi:hypothetical protein D3C84_894060 [compost metagenome]
MDLARRPMQKLDVEFLFKILNRFGERRPMKPQRLSSAGVAALLNHGHVDFHRLDHVHSPAFIFNRTGGRTSTGSCAMPKSGRLGSVTLREVLRRLSQQKSGRLQLLVGQPYTHRNEFICGGVGMYAMSNDLALGTTKPPPGWTSCHSAFSL